VNLPFRSFLKLIELRRDAKDFARVGGIRLAVFVHIGGKYLLGRKGLQLGRAAQGAHPTHDQIYIMAEALWVVWPWPGDCPHMAEGAVGVAGAARLLITSIGYTALVSKA